MGEVVKRQFTYVLTFDDGDMTKAPIELMKYLLPTGEALAGVRCNAVSVGNAVSELERVSDRLNRIIVNECLDEELES